MANTRQCPFTGCGRRIDPAYFACPKHWYSLSRGDQARIYRCYDQWKKGEIDGDELRRLQQEVLDEAQQ